MSLVQIPSLRVPPTSPSSGSKCSSPGEKIIRCSLSESTSISKKLLPCLAASLLLVSPPTQALPVEPSGHQSIYQIAAATDNGDKMRLDSILDNNNGMLMMRGMSMKNFDPVRYSGRWFEVASLKRGFAGQGQEDCHCTQGVYTFDAKTPSIQVDTFCVHGSPDGYITGIRGRVQCLSEEDAENAETDLEKQEMIREKCYLRFPTIPFIPKEPYDVIATDYDNFALVSGAKDRSFIQIYSRTPTPGTEFITKYKAYLANFGYDPSKIKDTPQDCEVMSSSQLALMMSMPGMNAALTNQFPDLGLKAPIELNPFTSIFDTLKKLLELYFK
ncbi:chloroplastic lipocalin [Typha angustifolia]|uniref:chloroplastic lipocalin n=1 Tax=Typha angustifolia TaxID=59011 RepID=UPI003C2F7CE6